MGELVLLLQAAPTPLLIVVLYIVHKLDRRLVRVETLLNGKKK